MAAHAADRWEHERPWAAPTQPAVISQVIPTPDGIPWHSLAITAAGKLVGQRQASSTGATPSVAIIAEDGHTTPFPATASSDLANPIELTADDAGHIWILDAGVRSEGPWSLTEVDGRSETPLGHWPLPPETRVPGSRFAALVIHGNFAYLADEGHAALAVLNLHDGKGKRFIEDDPSVRGRQAMVVAGKPVLDANGHAIARDVSLLALTHDGKWLFYQPPCGPLYRLSTELLTDPSYGPVEQLDGIVKWRETPTLGGMTTSANDTLYMTDVASAQLLSFSSARIPLWLLRDPRLAQAAVPTVTPDGHTLYVPVAGGPSILKIALPPQ
ncbi:L-dopachrome tautomerase-related protein [Brytella acorum]|uniref:L-dopachrome tautomerase-related protein n=1 Tax=Brytella acorum TaxID=2959299 RepID=A0AA35Y3U6_9PROT|nr:L-dopachrome tautomerase-related protein [Brytella acorum]MDF3624235.1 L-dopachrome tautomerase-related protein [Brytella acorum]CAI9121191.1 L-dopachrome tautomerase-related protein [Brytella acorum]